MLTININKVSIICQLGSGRIIWNTQIKIACRDPERRDRPKWLLNCRRRPSECETGVGLILVWSCVWKNKKKIHEKWKIKNTIFKGKDEWRKKIQHFSVSKSTFFRFLTITDSLLNFACFENILSCKIRWIPDARY